MGENIPTLHKTKPDKMSSSSTPDNLTRTFSPGPTCLTLSSSQNMARTFTAAYKSAGEMNFLKYFINHKTQYS